MKYQLVLVIAALGALTSVAADKKIVFIAGKPSHGPGEHEHRAGSLLLKKCLDETSGFISVVHSNGWPADNSAFEGADAVVIYSDGGGGHPALQRDHLKVLGQLMSKGVGLGCIHYAVEVPKDKGGPEFLDWIGGYFEAYWSVNPHWDGKFSNLPAHPVTKGVKPFTTRDEWYYHMRFREGMQGVTPILTAVPPDSTRGKPGVNDAHGGNPEVQKHKGEAEHTMWVAERDGGGRGFGVTGGHFHRNWGNDDFRRTVLNAIAWIAKADVPANGIQSTVSAEDLAANLDDKSPRRPKPATAVTNVVPKTEPFVSPTLPGK
jgi:type 1 glutamine amidotransferase